MHNSKRTGMKLTNDKTSKTVKTSNLKSNKMVKQSNPKNNWNLEYKTMKQSNPKTLGPNLKENKSYRSLTFLTKTNRSSKQKSETVRS